MSRWSDCRVIPLQEVPSGAPANPLRHSLVVISLLVLLAGCGGGRPGTPVRRPPVATIGGAPISQALFDEYLKERSGVSAAEVSPALKSALLTDLKQVKAAALLGEKTADGAFEQEMELKRLDLLAHRAASAAGVDEPPTEADLRQAYQSFVATLPASEYRVSHILVATQNAAAVLIVKLQSGADFAKLASTESADSSKTKGGDLGWIVPGKLPAPFTEAVKALKPGQFTAKPVQTIYGWHVIRLLKTRSASAPAFDQVKAQIAATWQQDHYRKFLEDALRSATTTPP